MTIVFAMLLFGLTVFMSAFLLFQMELLIGKHVLPWFGGVPAVWNTCMLFFQVLLTAGYGYSHLLAQKAGPDRQRRVHLALLGLAVLALGLQALVWPAPLLAGPAWKPASSYFPIPRILALLTVSIGLPFLVLASTSSLIQVWFARRYPARSPYWLYALSNAGSILGLVSYPFLVEPALGLRMQALLWAALFGLTMTAFGACCVMGTRRSPAGNSVRLEPSAGAGLAPRALNRFMIALWMLLAAVPSLLLLATTSVISEEVSVVPFLWIVPLGAYLASFIVCFSGRGWYVRWMFGVAGGAALLMLLSVMLRAVGEVGVGPLVGVYSFALFVVCMICHGELVRLRPPVGNLTTFYFALSVGGALGGVFSGMIAPHLFREFWELYIGYWGCAALLIGVMELDSHSAFHGRFGKLARRSGYFFLGVLAVSCWLIEEYQLSGINHPIFNRVYYAVHGKKTDAREPVGVVLASRRNFYGRLRVREWHKGRDDWHYRSLAHGRTLHGTQFQAAERRNVLYSYYSSDSGFGMALKYKRERIGPADSGLRMGVVGMGAGTLAAAGEEGDFICFYEINPVVLELATGPGAFFTYLQDSLATTEVVLGDARISLEREEPRQFDILVLDAFSGDSPPVHLLTREAMDLYFRHLKPDGILAVHVSNRYINYRPVVWRLADALGVYCTGIHLSPDDSFRCFTSVWMLLTRDRGFGQDPDVLAVREPRSSRKQYDSVRLWTDDYSNIYRLIKRRTSVWRDIRDAARRWMKGTPAKKES